MLRQRLDSIGLSLPPGRRKATELSLLTLLVEGRLQPQPLPHAFIDLYLECLVGAALVRVYKGGDVPDKFCVFCLLVRIDKLETTTV